MATNKDLSLTLRLLTVLVALLSTVTKATGPLTTDVTLVRGRSVDVSLYLYRHISGNRLPVLPSCRIEVIGNNSFRCGSVKPEIINCMRISNITEVADKIKYQHYGCFSDREILEFRIFNATRIGVISYLKLTVNIVPGTDLYQNVLDGIGIEARNSSQQSGSPRFYQLVTKFSKEYPCYYAVTTHPDIFSIPRFGYLSGPTNVKYPCGYTPSSPVEYRFLTRSNDTLGPITEFVFVTLWSFGDDSDPIYGIIKISFADTTDNGAATSHSPPEEPLLLTVNPTHTGYTSLRTEQLFPESSQKRKNAFKFITTNNRCGSIVTSRFPLSENVSFFSMDDLNLENVVFQPPSVFCETAAVYRIDMFSLVGSPLGSVHLEITLARPSIVPVSFLYLKSDRKANLTLLFRNISQHFGNVCAGSITRPPRYGRLLGNTKNLSQITVSKLLYSPPKAFTYSYAGVSDSLTWRLQCQRGKRHNYTTLIQVLPYPPKVSCVAIYVDESVSVPCYQGYATQLGTKYLDIIFPDTSNYNVRYGLSVGSPGSVFLVTNPKNSWQMFESLKSFNRTVLPLQIDFTQDDWIAGRVWLACKNDMNTPSSFTITITYTTSTCSGFSFLNVNVLDAISYTLSTELSLHSSLTLTNNGLKFPSLQSKKESKIHRIYGHSLSVSSTLPPSSVVFRILQQPLGKICLNSSFGSCDVSIYEFTQSDIDELNLYYIRPSNNFSQSDAFKFSLVNHSVVDWFVITPTNRQYLCQSDARQSYVAVLPGDTVPIQLDYFRFPFQLTDSETFEVVKGPSQGGISLNSFTVSDIRNNLVTYIAKNRSSMLTSCTDGVIVALVNSSVSLVAEVMFGLFQFSNLSVQIKDRVFNKVPTQISSQNIKVTTSCPDLVTIEVVRAPVNGWLELNNGLPIARSNCSVGLLDINGSRLKYNTSHLLNDSVTFRVTFVDFVNYQIPAYNSGPFTLHLTYSKNPLPVLTVSENVLIRKLHGTSEYGFNLNEVIIGAKPEDFFYLTTDDFADIAFLINGSTLKTENPAYSLLTEHLLFNTTSAEMSVNHIYGTQIDHHHVNVFWSFIYFDQPVIAVQASKEIQKITIPVNRRGSLEWEVSAVVRIANISGTITGGQLSSAGGVEEAMEVEIIFLPFVNNTEIILTINSGEDRKLGFGSISLQLEGKYGAIPWPEIAATKVNIQEFSVIGFAVNDSQDGRRKFLNCDLGIKVPRGVTHSLKLRRIGNLNEAVSVNCYIDNLFEDAYYTTKEYTVNFPPGSAAATCDVKVAPNFQEHTELIQVYLRTTGGNAILNESADHLCIFVINEVNNITFFFPKNEETVEEKSGAHYFEIRRNVIRDEDSTVRYKTMVFANDTGLENRDFISTSGSLHFSGRQRFSYIEIELIATDDYYGNRTFHLAVYVNNQNIIYLLITITDRRVIRIGLEQTEFKFTEDQGTVEIPVFRSGDLSLTISHLSCYFHCSSTAICVNKQVSAQPFQHNSNRTVCPFEIDDDLVHQGMKTIKLNIVFESNSSSISCFQVGKCEATINLFDPEDVPTIGFADETLVVDEPVYINPSDVNIVTIQLVRSGDPYISLTVGIRVVPMVNNNRLAVENIDYTLDAKNVTFLPEENLTNISMTILANHDRDTDTEVVFELQPLTTGNITISQSLLKVIISNFPITGAYFPARPYIDSQSCEGCMELDGTYPFFCSVACEEEQFQSFCREHSVSVNKTIYRWQVSMDKGATFQYLKLETLLHSSEVRSLDPVYVTSGLMYRCQATAVSSEDVPGITHTSKPVMVATGRSCYAKPPSITFDITPVVKGDSLTNETIVRLTIEVRHLNNMFPLISAKPLPKDALKALLPPENGHHICSNFISSSVHSFAGPQTIPVQRKLSVEQVYDKYLKGCYWVFESWHVLSDLVEHCGYNVVPSHVHGNREFHMTIQSTYINETSSAGILPMNITKVGTYQDQTKPMFYLQKIQRDDAEFFPLALNTLEVDNVEYLVIYFKTIIKDHSFDQEKSNAKDAHNNTFNSPDLELLSSGSGEGFQLWKATTRNHICNDYNFYMYPCDISIPNLEKCIPKVDKIKVFPLRIFRNGPNCQVGVKVILTVPHTSRRDDHGNALLYKGESVILELAVDSSQVLNFGTTMSVTSVTVCSTTKQCFSEDKLTSFEQWRNSSYLVGLSFLTDKLSEGVWNVSLQHMFSPIGEDSSPTDHFASLNISIRASINTPKPAGRFPSYEPYLIGFTVILALIVVAAVTIVTIFLILLGCKRYHKRFPPDAPEPTKYVEHTVRRRIQARVVITKVGKTIEELEMTSTTEISTSKENGKDDHQLRSALNLCGYHSEDGSIEDPFPNLQQLHQRSDTALCQRNSAKSSTNSTNVLDTDTAIQILAITAPSPAVSQQPITSTSL